MINMTTTKTKSTKINTKSATKSSARGQAKSSTKGVSSDGEWKTIKGVHVLIKNGKVTKGPSNLIGKKTSEISGTKAKKRDTSGNVASAKMRYPEYGAGLPTRIKASSMEEAVSLFKKANKGFELSHEWYDAKNEYTLYNKKEVYPPTGGALSLGNVKVVKNSDNTWRIKNK